MNLTLRHLHFFFISILFLGCAENEPATGKLTISFAHHADNSPLLFNQMIYTDAAGNHFEVKELQYFISDVTLLKNQGVVKLSHSEAAHYVDTNLPETLSWEVGEKIPAGTYHSLQFTFGLSELNNKPGTFVNPPESNMLWPYSMGGDNGGYHYMKFNGFWLNESQERTPFNVHLGVGQIYNEQREVTGFVQNYFTVTIPVTIMIPESQTRSVTLVMDIKSWFDSPQIYDHNDFGSMIMANQDAMSTLCNNGKDAFSLVVE